MNKSILWTRRVLIVIFLASFSLVEAQTGSSIVPDHVVLTWTADTQSSQTVTWRTSSAFEFLVFGDSQSGKADKLIYEPWKATVQKAMRSHANARFAVNVGDLVEVGGRQAHWNAWFDAVCPAYRQS